MNPIKGVIYQSAHSLRLSAEWQDSRVLHGSVLCLKNYNYNTQVMLFSHRFPLLWHTLLTQGLCLWAPFMRGFLSAWPKYEYRTWSLTPTDFVFYKVWGTSQSGMGVIESLLYRLAENISPLICYSQVHGVDHDTSAQMFLSKHWYNLQSDQVRTKVMIW